MSNEIKAAQLREVRQWLASSRAVEPLLGRFVEEAIVWTLRDLIEEIEAQLEGLEEQEHGPLCGACHRPYHGSVLLPRDCERAVAALEQRTDA